LDIYYAAEISKPSVNANALTIIAVCASKEDAKEKCTIIFECYINEFGRLDGFKENVFLIRW
ncbi:hypothetical protein LJB89_01105, partial [Tyzzerella sp. OttesenSCG-928-J15]|nr:hypothetical protein [Tyzzerella sp. OttesenSCG-928-J15]